MSDTPPAVFDGTTAYLNDEADLNDVETMAFLLGNKHRQYVLLYLLSDQTSHTVSAGELATWIAAIEANVPLTQVSSDRRRSIRVTLINNHLPKLDDANAIDHNATRNFVKIGTRFDKFAHALLQLLLTLARAD